MSCWRIFLCGFLSLGCGCAKYRCSGSIHLGVVFVLLRRQDREGVFVRMCMCYGVTYVMQIEIVYVGVETLHVSEMMVPVIAILITTPVNFVLNKRFAFKNRAGEKT